jgi:hypothetical protein
MSEEQNKSEKEVVPNPEGYTLVKYSEVAVFFCFFLFTLLFIPIVFLLKGDDGHLIVGFWLYLLLYLVFCLLGMVVGHKLTEAKVNLKLTEKGLEQTRLSGSRFVPEYRTIPWSDMNKVFLFGRNRSVSFLICVDEGVDLRISMPTIRMFERQKANDDVLEQFRDEFKEMGMQHGLMLYGVFQNKLKRT